MPNHRLAVLAAVCVSPMLLLLASCQDKSIALRQYMADEITGLKYSDAKADLDAALAKGDYRFLGLHGIGPMIPAVDDTDVDMVEKRFGIRYIENTTDKPQDEQEKELNRTAWGYAEQYNSLLRKKVRMEH